MPAACNWSNHDPIRSVESPAVPMLSSTLPEITIVGASTCRCWRRSIGLAFEAALAVLFRASFKRSSFMLRKWLSGRLVEASTGSVRSAFRRRLSGRGLVTLFFCLATAHAESGLTQAPQFFAPDPLPLAPTYSASVAHAVEPIAPEWNGAEPPLSPGFVEQASYADTVAQNAATATPNTDAALAELRNRLDDVEGQLRKRDAADKKAADKRAAEEFPSHKITGFTQLDTGFFSQDPRNIATVGDMQNGTGFRRARLAVNGKVREFTAYQIEVDFATAGRPAFSTFGSNRAISRGCRRSRSDSFANRSASTRSPASET